jgi:transketolase
MALGERLSGSGKRVYCLISDGELQEGQVWEAFMSAVHYRLDNLVVLVDNNGMQADGSTAEIMAVEPVTDRLRAFGLAAMTVDGNDVPAILAGLASARSSSGKPAALTCYTRPGRGVASFETHRRVHYIRAEDKVWQQALEELEHASPSHRKVRR